MPPTPALAFSGLIISGQVLVPFAGALIDQRLAASRAARFARSAHRSIRFTNRSLAYFIAASSSAAAAIRFLSRSAIAFDRCAMLFDPPRVALGDSPSARDAWITRATLTSRPSIPRASDVGEIRRHRQRLHLGVERLVIVAELFEVRQIAWTCPVAQGDNQARAFGGRGPRARTPGCIRRCSWAARPPASAPVAGRRHRPAASRSPVPTSNGDSLRVGDLLRLRVAAASRSWKASVVS